MCTLAVAARLAQTEDVASLVLEAERAALAEVENFKLQTLRLVATSWLRAELVHKRTEARTRRLRQRMTTVAQLRQQQISSEMEALAGDKDTDGSIPAALDSAIGRVTQELAATPESS
ncbi:MAG: hypothetical protein D4R84_01790 [Rhodocyclaceae bacterium]|nr:MAG: hypothetical protein D4R84_01790 [Rhodocyclaceae bacterium]